MYPATSLVNMDFNRFSMYEHYEDSYPPTKCTIELKNAQLWREFHECGTEMIITKSGRRMFPSLNVQIANLDPEAHYCIFLEMMPVSHCRFKYSTAGGWAPAGTEDAQSSQRVYIHPDSPATGEYWMSQPLSFSRLRLTNTVAPPTGHLVLSSMHKYQPRIMICKTSDTRNIAWAPSVSKIFPETQFIAVTAYQNEKITQLKIDNNPFAKGFRENGQAKCKRKRNEKDERKDGEEKKKSKLDDDRVSSSSHSSAPCSSESSNGIISNGNHESPRSYPCYFQCTNYLPTCCTMENSIYYPNSFYHPVMLSVRSPMMYQNIKPYSLPQTPETFSVNDATKIAKPKKNTDFSIRAITGCS